MSKVLSWVGAVALFAALVGCEKSTAPKTQGTLSFSSRYSSALPPQVSMMKASGTAGVDSIRISRARFVIRDVKFKSEVDSLEFKSAPFVLDLNISSSNQEIAVRDVPFATYGRVEFDVHRIESAEVNLLPVSERGAFTDFLAGERYSIIVEGTVYRTPESDVSFVVRSKIDAKQKVDLIPGLTISESNSVANTTMLISSGGWFLGQTGGLLDPSDPSNESQIGENLKNSIRVFKDNNKDGSKDPN